MVKTITLSSPQQENIPSMKFRIPDTLTAIRVHDDRLQRRRMRERSRSPPSISLQFVLYVDEQSHLLSLLLNLVKHLMNVLQIRNQNSAFVVLPNLQN
ncbi:hypothetical protein ACJIZ3_003516 [Penstemon smallii]|uniref:Uncharacterized protein n=1 Tax=Penstemon smallii TaxID=265156 RepID=A0ABD3UC62_9LAMI